MPALVEKNFDFIVVGGGTAGCLLASRLAHTSTKPRIALIEQGDDTRESHHRRIAFDRSMTFMTSPELSYFYPTNPSTPGRVGDGQPYCRGRGLGGSSQVNFTLWTVGPSDDYDRWANIVKDDTYSWENVRHTYNRIVTYNDGDVKDSAKKYMNFDDFERQSNGELRVGFPAEYTPDTELILKAAELEGWQVNPNINGGDPIGIGG